ncbi:MAG: polyribonucleotide nucleotidyltransferase [Bacteroidota bacterium]
MITKKTIHKVPQKEGFMDITIEVGELAGQADGSVVVRSGNAMLLATVVEREETENLGFLPLSVDYQEKFYAAGKIPGGFLKREGKASEHEILISRLVDRALRPCFPKGYNHAVQVTLWLISADKHVSADTLAILGASAALSISHIPVDMPVSGVRVARIDGRLCLNPINSDLKKADMDLMVAATPSSIIMLEGKMKEVGEKDVLEAIAYGYEAIQMHCDLLQALAAQSGIQKAAVDQAQEDVLLEAYEKHFYAPCYEIAKSGMQSKKARNKAFEKVRQAYVATLAEEDRKDDEIDMYFTSIRKKVMTDLLVKEGKRIDGRGTEDIRQISTIVDYIPSAHGSALFTRGETQSLATVTLGGKLDEQLLDGATVSGYSKIMLHYNFPGFSTGEIKPARGPARREIGHAALALNSLKPVLPENDPKTIRIVSEILESNGSSSMATVASSSAALADAGVPIKRLVAGIAMGSILAEDRPIILSDISGDEDYFGNMDFKIAGTEQGFNAIQLDTKLDLKNQKLDIETVDMIVRQAQKGIMYILKKINLVIAEPRQSYKPHAPITSTLQIDKTKIGALIGPGGKVIKDIQESTKANLDIAEKSEYAVVTVFAPNQEASNRAIERIKSITAVPVIGQTYQGKIKNIQDFGVFVEFMPGKDGLLHISEMSEEKLDTLEGLFEIGQEIEVKLIKIHAKTGKFGLSILGLYKD